jgi:hypothetical protein
MQWVTETVRVHASHDTRRKIQTLARMIWLALHGGRAVTTGGQLQITCKIGVCNVFVARACPQNEPDGVPNFVTVCYLSTAAAHTLYNVPRPSVKLHVLTHINTRTDTAAQPHPKVVPTGQTAQGLPMCVCT